MGAREEPVPREPGPGGHLERGAWGASPTSTWVRDKNKRTVEEAVPLLSPFNAIETKILIKLKNIIEKAHSTCSLACSL